MFHINHTIKKLSFFRSKNPMLLILFILCFCSCADSETYYLGEKLPEGTYYYKDTEAEYYLQKIESFARFHELGEIGCETDKVSPEMLAICGQGISKGGHYPALTVLHPEPRTFPNFPVSGTENDSIDLKNTYKWKNETASGTLLRGPFLEFKSGGKLMAEFTMQATLNILKTFPTKVPLKTLDIPDYTTLFTLELVADGEVLDSKDFDAEELINDELCSTGAYGYENDEKIYLNYNEENGQSAKMQMAQYRCFLESKFRLEANTSGPVKNVEARVILEDSPVNLVLRHTIIAHYYK